MRDLGPDPVYDEATGEPLPDADGSFLRASTLYRWLTNGIRELTRRCNWTVLDWTAMAQETRQQIYAVDRRFVNVEACFANQYRLMHLDELHTMYPSYAVAQPLWFSWHHRSDRLELSLWPAPDRTDPSVHLMISLSPITDTIAVSSTAGFLPFGWVQIEQELIQYSALLPATGPADHPRLAVVRRGVSGTTQSFHSTGTPVTHLSIWARGHRTPAAVRRSTDCVEIPFAFQAPLENYVLSKYRESEQDSQGARSLMQQFLEEVNSILTDPIWQQTPWPSQVSAYGSHAAGQGLYYGRIVVP